MSKFNDEYIKKFQKLGEYWEENQYPQWIPLRRTFEAKKYPKPSEQRTMLNKSALTSEYMPSYKYIVYYGKQPYSQDFRTKREAEEWIEREKPRWEKTRGMSIQEMTKLGYL